MRAKREIQFLTRDVVGQTGEFRAPVVNTLARKGVSLHPQSVADIRGGRHSGTTVDFRYGCGLFLEDGDAHNKNNYYAAIAAKGLAGRERQEKHPDRFSHLYFTSDVVANFTLRGVTLRYFLRAMRADIAYEDLIHPNDETRQAFCEVANRFLNAFTTPRNSKTPAGPLAIVGNWNGFTIEHFYRTMYAYTSDTGIAIWEPFEAEFFQAYYGAANPDVQLSAFDRMVLQAIATHTAKEQAVLIQKRTGIPIDKEVFGYHAKALMTSYPPVEG